MTGAGPGLSAPEETRKYRRSRFQRQIFALAWKCYLQRQRRWRSLIVECVFAFLLFLIAILVARPVFLTPLQDEPIPPLAATDVLASVSSRNLLGYAPNTPPYDAIMTRAGELLQNLKLAMFSAATEDDLNSRLYNRSNGTLVTNPVIWVIFHPAEGNNMYKFSIRSTERAKYETSGDYGTLPNPHLRAGFLGVQTAVSQALLEHASPTTPNFKLTLAAMPVSPLMQEDNVRRTISAILLCFTLALISPVIETQAMVVHETVSKFKRALRMRHVDFSTMYLAWMIYAYLSAIPICMMAAFTLMLIFRWIHIMFALVIMLAYISVMIMLGLIMAMFHSTPWIACLWSVLFTLLQTFLAELLVHHKYDVKHEAFTFALHIFLPPMGLVHALNQFALLQTGIGPQSKHSLFYTVFSWTMMNLIYFALLMLLQRTLGREAIGGAVSWKSIIFKKAEDKTKLREIINPNPVEIAKLQEVDDLVAKAISFRNVTKNVMNVTMLNNISLDIYRGEFTMLFSERVQEKMIITIEDLLTGLSYQDAGTINVLGQILNPGDHCVAMPQMMGYCHRSHVLIDDLTVQEHIILYLDICLWNESKQYIHEYVHIRSHYLKRECDLESVWYEYVYNLGYYYRAQLCWALALLLEPRIIFIPNFTDKPSYVSVIKDKIMNYKKYMTVVLMCFSSIQLEYADRLFIFDNKVLVFGGTPAYMFFKYGREYRVRMTFRHSSSPQSETTRELLEHALAAGASVRAHLGSLLILRLPSSPTDKVAAFIKELDQRANVYGITSLNISLPDSEEVSRRAIHECRAAVHETSVFHHNLSREALKRIADKPKWKRERTCRLTLAHFKVICWKFLCFYCYNKSLIFLTLLSAILAGIFIGTSLASILTHLDQDRFNKKLLLGENLTVEAFQQSTTLILRSDFTNDSTSVANAYVLSETKATAKEISHMTYTALSHTESLTEYLVTRAIDSPQQYVYMYAYGIDVSSDGGGNLAISALYSPIHKDSAAAARSLARLFMALMRHYTKQLDASIQVIDNPLSLDLTRYMEYAVRPPLLIQFLLVMTISHITLIPSKEFGIVRHLQSHATNFSPTRYWFSLFLCDLMLYWILVAITVILVTIVIYCMVPPTHFEFLDLAILPLILIVYGISCIPQAYLFSLGPVPALNTMTYVIVNIVFGETTVIAKLFYGDTLHYALYFMRLSPQFNMAYAYVKIKQIFLYNTKCGILQKCYKSKHYLTWQPGVLVEITAMAGTAVMFMLILLLWEHRVFQRSFRWIKSWFVLSKVYEEPLLTDGAKREKSEVLGKFAQMKSKKSEKVVTFGEYLLSVNMSRKTQGVFALRDIYLGLGKGEVLALSGLKRHGRSNLVMVLSGYQVPSLGEVYCMSKWKLKNQPHWYSKHVSLCCESNPLPLWMTVYDSLYLLAVLRGVPKKDVQTEVKNYIEALELHDQAKVRICDLLPTEKARLHFAAAVIAAPPVLVMDECTAYQKYSVRRAMYYILSVLKRRSHAIFISSSNVESHLPITNRLAILLDGVIYDIDHIDALVERHSHKGCTVVVHLKDEVNVGLMFDAHFHDYEINDSSEVLVNVQVYDDITWTAIFEKMEKLKASNPEVYSYIISAIPIDYIYNSIISNERGLKQTDDLISLFCLKKLLAKKNLRKPPPSVMEGLVPFEKKYGIIHLLELPWSVIFQR